MIEQAPHLEFDATALVALPQKDRDIFVASVNNVLGGTSIDSLSPLHRFLLGNCSRVLETFVLDSSDEEEECGMAKSQEVLDSVVGDNTLDEGTHIRHASEPPPPDNRSAEDQGIGDEGASTFRGKRALADAGGVPEKPSKFNHLSYFKDI